MGINEIDYLLDNEFVELVENIIRNAIPNLLGHSVKPIDILDEFRLDLIHLTDEKNLEADIRSKLSEEERNAFFTLTIFLNEQFLNTLNTLRMNLQTPSGRITREDVDNVMTQFKTNILLFIAELRDSSVFFQNTLPNKWYHERFMRACA